MQIIKTDGDGDGEVEGNKGRKRTNSAYLRFGEPGRGYAEQCHGFVRTN